MRDARITSLPAGMPPWRKAVWIVLGLLLALGAVWWLYHRATSQGGSARRFAANAPLPVVVSPVKSGNIDIIYSFGDIG